MQQNTRMRGHSVGLMLRLAVENFGFAVAYLIAVGRVLDKTRKNW
jgi:hypothetical protein